VHPISNHYVVRAVFLSYWCNRHTKICRYIPKYKQSKSPSYSIKPYLLAKGSFGTFNFKYFGKFIDGVFLRLAVADPENLSPRKLKGYIVRRSSNLFPAATLIFARSARVVALYFFVRFDRVVTLRRAEYRVAGRHPRAAEYGVATRTRHFPPCFFVFPPPKKFNEWNGESVVCGSALGGGGAAFLSTSYPPLSGLPE